MAWRNITEKWDLCFLLKASVAWAGSALVLLLLASLIVSKANMGMGPIGYVSSSVSFLAAVFAGAYAAKERKGGGFYTGFMTAAIISMVLLTVGFIIEGQEIDASGVLSVVTFTFSGCLVGSVFLGGRKNKAKRTQFSPKLRH